MYYRLYTEGSWTNIGGKMDLLKVKEVALLEYEEEKFRTAVEEEKEKLRQHKSMWDKVFPWKLIILRKDV